ncbi:MAG: UbiD family decarboxylase, partial [Rhodospirillales bacterium]|nr:UbiD family decarboxylase [Rhodospirillales bacterium]
RDPDTGWVNCGSYRLMIMDNKTVGHNVVPGHHASVHLKKYQARGERMPMVMVLGGDPMTFFMASSIVPEGVGEMDVVGRMRGKPVEVVKGPITGLPIPANAEIALEGYVNLDRIEPEGPFGDWTGTYTEKGRVDPVVDIQAIYHRNDPILLGFVPQALPDEFSRFFAITRSAVLKRDIKAAGVPDVQAAWAHEIGGARILFGVSIKQRYAGHSKQAGHVASMVGANNGNRWVIVTDEDVDVVNLEELIYAALTRSDPATSVDLIRGAQGSKADPRLNPWDRDSGNHTNSRLIFDACRPFHWRDEVPEPTKPSEETARDAQAMFGYLLED